MRAASEWVISPTRRSDQAVLMRVGRGRRSGGDAELRVQVAHVPVDGPDADDQICGDPPVRLPGAEQAQHLQLALGEPVRIDGVAETRRSLDPGEIGRGAEAREGLPGRFQLKPRGVLVPEVAAGEPDQLSGPGALVWGPEPLPELACTAERRECRLWVARGQLDQPASLRGHGGERAGLLLTSGDRVELRAALLRGPK